MRTLTIVITLILSALSGVAHSYREVVLTNGEWQPVLSDKLKDGGFGSQIVEKAFALVGYKVKWQFLPWKRAYMQAEEGICDGTVLWVKTPEREKIFRFSDTVIRDMEYFYHLRNTNFNWETISDLSPYRIGLNAHATYPRLEEAIAAGDLQVWRGGGYEALLLRILAGHVHAVPMNELAAKGYFALLPSDDQDQITFHPKPLQVREYRLMINRNIFDASTIIKDFNEGLRQLKESGRYDELRYGE